MKKIAIFIMSIGLICIFSGVAFATIFKVPSDYSTIQAGIDAASDGDTVLVADGVYVGEGNRDLVFGGKIITLQSENGPANSIIDCQGVGRALSSKPNTSARDVVIRGFTIKNGVANDGGAIYWGYTSANLTVEDCIFYNNSNAAIRTSALKDDSTVTISNCDFIGNEGAVYPMNGGHAVITDCVFDGNTDTFRAGAIRATGGTKTDIKNCIFTGNISDYAAGAISFEMGNHRLANCIFAGNRAGGRGGAIYTSHLLDLKGSLTIINSTFSDNKAHTGGAIWLSSDSFPIITNSILWENTPNEIAGDGVPTVTYSDVMTASVDPYPGQDNINSNPMFFAHGYWDDNGTPSDPSDDFWVDGDYHLTYDSPCKDTGTSAGAPNDDIDGDSRPQGSRYDMGADEYLPPYDTDGDGIHDDVDEDRLVPSTRFSDISLDGLTSGEISGLDTGITVEIKDAPNPNDGVKVVVSGPADGEAKIKIDGSKGLYNLSLGEYILTSGSVILQCLTGIAEVEFTIEGKMIVVLVEGTAIFEEIIITDELKELVVQTDEGYVTVDGEVLLPGESLTVMSVLIDIKPGSDPNCINSNGHGAIPVAILSTPDFDATQVDPATASLDGQAIRVVGKGNTQAHIEDVNGDGLDDFIAQFEDTDGTYQVGDTVATLTAETFAGISIVGTDTLCIVP